MHTKHILIMAALVWCFFTLGACSQRQEQQTHFTAHEMALLHFYELLFSSDATYSNLASVYWDPEKDTGLLRKLKLMKPALTADTTLVAIQTAVRNATWTDQGLQFGLYAAVQLTSQQTVYFEMTKDTPTYIEYIWLSDGTLLHDRLKNKSNPRYLLLVGCIVDSDGFVNIRNAPEKSAKVNGTMPAGTVVYYSPNGQLPWVKVYKKDAQEGFLGYVHLSRIMPFERLKPKQQAEIRLIRNRD